MISILFNLLCLGTFATFGLTCSLIQKLCCKRCGRRFPAIENCICQQKGIRLNTDYDSISCASESSSDEEPSIVLRCKTPSSKILTICSRSCDFPSEITICYEPEEPCKETVKTCTPKKEETNCCPCVPGGDTCQDDISFCFVDQDSSLGSIYSDSEAIECAREFCQCNKDLSLEEDIISNKSPLPEFREEPNKISRTSDQSRDISQFVAACDLNSFSASISSLETSSYSSLKTNSSSSLKSYTASCPKNDSITIPTVGKSSLDSILSNLDSPRRTVSPTVVPDITSLKSFDISESTSSGIAKARPRKKSPARNISPGPPPNSPRSIKARSRKSPPRIIALEPPEPPENPPRRRKTPPRIIAPELPETPPGRPKTPRGRPKTPPRVIPTKRPKSLPRVIASESLKGPQIIVPARRSTNPSILSSIHSEPNLGSSDSVPSEVNLIQPESAKSESVDAAIVAIRPLNSISNTSIKSWGTCKRNSSSGKSDSIDSVIIAIRLLNSFPRNSEHSESPKTEQNTTSDTLDSEIVCIRPLIKSNSSCSKAGKKCCNNCACKCKGTSKSETSFNRESNFYSMPGIKSHCSFNSLKNQIMMPNAYCNGCKTACCKDCVFAICGLNTRRKSRCEQRCQIDYPKCSCTTQTFPISNCSNTCQTECCIKCNCSQTVAETLRLCKSKNRTCCNKESQCACAQTSPCPSVHRNRNNCQCQTDCCFKCTCAQTSCTKVRFMAKKCEKCQTDCCSKCHCTQTNSKVIQYLSQMRCCNCECQTECRTICKCTETVGQPNRPQRASSLKITLCQGCQTECCNKCRCTQCTLPARKCKSYSTMMLSRKKILRDCCSCTCCCAKNQDAVKIQGIFQMQPEPLKYVFKTQESENLVRVHKLRVRLRKRCDSNNRCSLDNSRPTKCFLKLKVNS